MNIHGSSCAMCSALIVVLSTFAIVIGNVAQAETPLVAGAVGPLRDVGGVGYVAPEGWSVSQINGAAVMTGPVAQQYQPCLLVIDPTVGPAGDLATQAEMIVNAAFGRTYGRYEGENGADVKAGQYQGLSATGWPYVDLLGHLGRSPFHVRSILARFNQRAVVLLGLFNAEKCLGSPYMRDNDVFLLVFHSLRLPGFAADSGQLGRQLIGTWQSIGSNVGLNLTYAPNGHFSDLGVVAMEYESPGGIVHETSEAWPGNGTYEVSGDRLTTVHTKGANTGVPLSRLFSIVRRPRPGRPGEYDEILRIVQRSEYGRTWGFGDSNNYVISYNRTK